MFLLKREKLYFEIIRGTSSIVDDVKNLYIKEFEKSKEDYNAKKTRDDRKI